MVTQATALTALQYRDALKRLGLTIDGAAKLQGISEDKSRKRAQGLAAIPPEAAALLRLMLAFRIDPKDAMARIASVH